MVCFWRFRAPTTVRTSSEIKLSRKVSSFTKYARFSVSNWKVINFNSVLLVALPMLMTFPGAEFKQIESRFSEWARRGWENRDGVRGKSSLLPPTPRPPPTFGRIRKKVIHYATCIVGGQRDEGDGGERRVGRKRPGVLLLAVLKKRSVLISYVSICESLLRLQWSQWMSAIFSRT